MLSLGRRACCGAGEGPGAAVDQNSQAGASASTPGLARAHVDGPVVARWLSCRWLDVMSVLKVTLARFASTYVHYVLDSTRCFRGNAACLHGVNAKEELSVGCAAAALCVAAGCQRLAARRLGAPPGRLTVQLSAKVAHGELGSRSSRVIRTSFGRRTSYYRPGGRPRAARRNRPRSVTAERLCSRQHS